MQETRRLAEFVVNGTYEALPGEVLDALRVLVLDDFACGFAGAHLPWTSMVADLAAENAVGGCSLFGRAETTSPPYAAFVNGVGIGGFECNHGFRTGSCQPSAAVFPAVLALAEQRHLDGTAFITALAYGYEAHCRVGAAATRAVEDERGFHGPGTNAPIGGAFGAGKALGLDTGTLVNATGVAASHGSGLLEFAVEGAMTKRLHVGRGAHLGVECAILAQKGFTGPSTALEGEHGFLRVYSPAPRMELLLQDIGQRFYLTDIAIRSYSCHGWFHGVVDAIQTFRATHAFAPESIESVSITSEAAIMEGRFLQRAPTTVLGAQYSMPWSAALALCGDIDNPQSWTSFDDANVIRLAGAMELREAPTTPHTAEANITLSIGGVRHELVAEDTNQQRTTSTRFDEAERKLRRYARLEISEATCDQIVERVAHLEDETDVASLARLIRAS